MSQPNTTAPEPKLAAPGAGVPFPQKVMMRFIVKPFIASRTPWEKAEKNFHRINEKILAAIEGLNETQLSTRVLVPPQIGLEDSSRYWSIKMALEHLVIVSTQMMMLIPALTRGVIPPGKADTGAVKPHVDVKLQDALTQYKKLITQDFDQLNAAIADRNSKTKFYHPWFGQMTAQHWYWLLGQHHAIHLKQIREIKKRLPLI
jgi:hypothetical protein